MDLPVPRKMRNSLLTTSVSCVPIPCLGNSSHHCPSGKERNSEIGKMAQEDKPDHWSGALKLTQAGFAAATLDKDDSSKGKGTPCLGQVTASQSSCIRHKRREERSTVLSWP